MSLGITEARHRYVALDSMRGICACMVVIYHCYTQGWISTLPIVRSGFLFVDFFFVLSGFVIGSSYGNRLGQQDTTIAKFMWLRFWRIYPLHFTMLLVFVTFEIFFAVFMPGLANRQPFTGDYSPATLIQSIFLVQPFIGNDATPWNGPSWSIAVEMWTYLIFALLLRFAWRWIVPISVVIAAAAAVYLSQLTDHFINVFHHGALERCLFGFALGIVAWRCIRPIQTLVLPKWGDHLLEIVVALGVVVYVTVAGAGPLSLAAPLVFLVAVLVFARERGLVSSVLKMPPLVLVGTLSYSIYMVHIFLYYRMLNGLSLLSKMTGEQFVATVNGHNMVGYAPLFGDAVTIVFTVLVIGCAYVSYRLIEEPGRALGKRLSGEKTRLSRTAVQQS